MTTLIDALKILDVKNNNHWTAEGLPRVDIIADLIGEKSLSRGDISMAFPSFTREHPYFEIQKQDSVQKDASVGIELQPNPDVIPDMPLGGVPDPFPQEKTEEEIQAREKELDALLAVAAEKLRKAEMVVTKAQRDLVRVQEQIDAIVREKEANKDPQENQKAIGAYLKKQQELRLARGGAKLSIDQSMIRRSGFGLGRPVTPFTR